MQHIASISYGKDSLAMLEAIKLLGWPLDRIVTAEVWATDTIPADLPPMQEFKEKADKIIKERYGIEVEHLCAKKDGKKLSYIDVFNYPIKEKAIYNRENKFNKNRCWKNQNPIYGFPYVMGAWCNSRLKVSAIQKIANETNGAIQYIGIAADEPKRFHNLSETKKSPLVEIGWTEADCRKWCEENDLLSPIYTDGERGGCWFCHNQGVDQLRKLRHNYPDLWELLMKWDLDSPVTFKADGHTVHDFDRRFQAEDDGLIYPDERFRWADLEQPQLRWF